MEEEMTAGLDRPPVCVSVCVWKKRELRSLAATEIPSLLVLVLYVNLILGTPSVVFVCVYL